MLVILQVSSPVPRPLRDVVLTAPFSHPVSGNGGTTLPAWASLTSQDGESSNGMPTGLARAIAGGRRVKTLRWWHLYSRPGRTARGGDFHPKLLHIDERASWCPSAARRWERKYRRGCGSDKLQTEPDVISFWSGVGRSSEMGGGSCELLSDTDEELLGWT